MQPGVLKRESFNLLVEIAPLVIANEVRADVLVASALGCLGLVLETAEECTSRSVA
jgi:hypothetical protein